MNKKAFEIQFNWLFVLVAGAAILIFFTVIITKQKSTSETSTQATILKSLESIVTSASVSIDTTNIIKIPNSNIEVSCDRISLGKASNQYQNLILFAPSSIKSDELITNTLAFNAPYRAANLLYITSRNLRYIIIGESSIAKEINKSMPSALSKEFYTSLPQIKNLNNRKVRFIVFGDMISFPSSLEKMADTDVTAIRLAKGDEEKGLIEFYQKRANLWLLKGVSPYIGKQSLIGAIYSDTLELYECNMGNVFTKLKLVTNVYADKANKLHLSDISTQCNDFYDKAMEDLNKILSASSEFNEQNVNVISDSAKSLSNENKHAQLYSCPLVY